jgi:V8-like Glu-specific endopeptidase
MKIENLVVLATLLTSACSMEMAEDADDFEHVAEAQEELKGGALVKKRGVVRIDFASGGFCAGAMIAPNYMITSAHCLRDIQDEGQGEFHGSVTYFDPDRGERLVATPGWLYGYRMTRGDAVQLDLAVVQKFSKWAETDNSDYLRLSFGSEAQIKKNSLYAYGYTPGAPEGGWDEKLRYINVTNEWADGKYFIHRASDEAGVCTGDSGGVHIARTDDDDTYKNVVVGLHSNHDPPEGNCARSGVKERALRMNEANIEWIERAMGKDCARGSNNGHPYARCWD